MRLTSTTSTNGITGYETTDYDIVYEIDELCHKKMVLKPGYPYTATDGNAGSTSEIYVLELK